MTGIIDQELFAWISVCLFFFQHFFFISGRIIDISPDQGTIRIHSPLKPNESREFVFDAVYNWK